MKRMILLMICIPISILLNAQIGYQVSLLNSATGEPRANETVTVEVELTDSENKIICSETKSATTNDFGVLSINVGTSSTFENMDWSKLPLYISATVDDILVGRSQILNVPVAEAAKKVVPVTQKIIGKTASYSNTYEVEHEGMMPHTTSMSFTESSFNMTRRQQYYRRLEDGTIEYYWKTNNSTGTYLVEGNMVFCFFNREYGGTDVFLYIYFNNILYGVNGETLYF